MRLLPIGMSKTNKKSLGLSFELQILIALLVLAAGVLAVAWGAAMKLRQTVADNAAVMNVDPGALIEVEQLRNLAETKIANRRAYFLLGSKSIYDKQKAETEQLTEALSKFEKQRNLPKVTEIVKSIEELQKQEQEIFDQGIEFREKQTESKIVAQFYQSKTVPLVSQINAKFDEIVKLHNAALEENRERARAAGLDAQAQIPKGMTTLTAALSALFLLMGLLVIRMLFVRRSHLRERERLTEEARKAILARDEVISAVASDFREPIQALNEIGDALKTPMSFQEVQDNGDLIKGISTEIQGIIEDISDQKKADMQNLTLRLDQLKVADILEDAQDMMRPLAKKRDITLQFDTLNQSTLAYVDRERVLRVLSNLVGNAIKFSPKHGRVSVKVKCDAQFVNISVLDSGSGIPEGQLAQIFDNFWQAPRTSDQGAGVGLSVVKTIIEAHGGTVTAEKSKVGQGTTLTFSLPRRRPVGAQIKKPTSSGVRRMGRPQSPFDNADGPTV